MLDEPQGQPILTHAHGYRQFSDFELVGFVDSDIRKAEAASARWGGAAFESIEALFETQQVDVVSVCTPDDLHYTALLALAAKPVKLIFLEKPAVRTPSEADEISSLYAASPVKVQVNYSRRFVPEIRKIREEIASGSYGKLITGIGYYGKGLFHNGSHMVDLLRFLVGEVEKIDKIAETADFYDNDPSVSALLFMRGGGSFYLRHIDCREFHIFELDLTFEKKRFRIYELGTKVEEYSVVDHEMMKDLRTLNKDREYSTEYSKAICHAIGNIRNNLFCGESLISPLEDSLETVRTCSRIMRGDAE